ncbi:hypothetical protein TRIUR3_21214 [Triticum urartu]|uniref:Uncharacterized protein n=1 Tax=Triticum urartu TaxID=4572 RepID=M7ZYJ9_TRIUA|nr:hypothetical protein TRIUR3_21214 [Triticum urartu]
MEDDENATQKSRFFRDARVEAMQRRVDEVHAEAEDPCTIFRLPAAVRERHPDLASADASDAKGRSNGKADANGASSLAVWKQSPVPSPRSSDGAVKGRLTSMVPQAAKMEEAGVTFKRKATPRDMFDVNFRYGVLHMPAFVVDEAAKVLLANLVAFEQGGGRAARQLDGGNLVTGFVALVGSLVNTTRDVEVLRRCGVMHCMLTHDEAVRYFSHVVQYTTMDYDRHLLACLFRDIREHCQWSR